MNRHMSSTEKTKNSSSETTCKNQESSLKESKSEIQPKLNKIWPNKGLMIFMMICTEEEVEVEVKDALMLPNAHVTEILNILEVDKDMF